MGKMVRMDRFTGRCWWSNSSTLLSNVEIVVDAVATADGWSVEGHLLSEEEEEREQLKFLCAMDPVFLLRFEDEGTIPVTVRLGEDGQFDLTEYTGSARQSINYQIDL